MCVWCYFALCSISHSDQSGCVSLALEFGYCCDNMGGLSIFLFIRLVIVWCLRLACFHPHLDNEPTMIHIIQWQKIQPKTSAFFVAPNLDTKRKISIILFHRLRSFRKYTKNTTNGRTKETLFEIINQKKETTNLSVAMKSYTNCIRFVNSI